MSGTGPVSAASPASGARRTVPGLATATAVLIAASAGCEPGSAPPSTSRDSLGVTIVESVAPAWSPETAWRIGEEPLVDLAETGSGEMHYFFRVRDMVRVGERLVVADGVSNEVRVYDSAGRFMRAFGGWGEGPGEFHTLWTMVSTGAGRLVAMDLRAGGPGAEFDLESGLVSTFRMPSEARPLRHPVPSDPLWAWDEGFIWGDEGMRLGFQRTQAAILLLAEDRMSAREIASVPGYELVVVPEADAIPLLARSTQAVPVGDGTIVVGTADALEYSILDGGTGEVLQIARILGISLAVSEEEIDHERQTRLGPNPRPFIRDLLEQMPVPDEKPAYQQMLVDVHGNVWAGEFLGLARYNEAQEWYVWDSSGVWLGIVETPARFELMRVDSAEVLGVRRDLNDVEHPQVLRLVK